MEIKIERAKTLKPKPAANTELGFGRYYTDHTVSYTHLTLPTNRLV